MNLTLALLFLFALTCVPALELRASIPAGLFALHAMFNVTLDWWVVATLCIVANIVLGIAIFELLRPCLAILLKWEWFKQRIWPLFEVRREKLRPVVEKHGEWGLALFIGVPLPGTGAVTGAVGAFLLGFSRKRFYLANTAGVLIAGICVTAICLLILNGVVSDDSWLSKLFINTKLAN